MRYKLFYLLIPLLLFPTMLLSQGLDTTLVIDGKLNVISPIDSTQNPAYNAIIGFPLRSYSDYIHSNFVYQLTLSGEIILDHTGKKSLGPVVSYVDTEYGFTEKWFVLTHKDTLEFVPGWVDDFYFHGYLFDPDTIGDNTGQFYIHLSIVAIINIESNELVEVSSFKLDQNYPNPFNSSTTIKYSIDEPSNVEINIYNVLGEKVTSLINAWQNAGRYSLKWNGLDAFGNSVNSGAYFYQIRTNNHLKTQRMVFLK
jgi:hypothetical protein